jgi:hypothetical protein
MKITIHNSETNEIIEREMTKDEKAFWKSVTDDKEKALAEAEAKEAAKSAILDRIGLTADELKTILG